MLDVKYDADIDLNLFGLLFDEIGMLDLKYSADIGLHLSMTWSPTMFACWW